MRKRFLAYLFGTLLALGGCAVSESGASLSSSADPSLITGIVLSGPSSLTVGESFTLGVDVLGSESDEVRLSSDGDGIISIEGLKVTALAVGKAVIHAISVENEAVFAEKTIEVIGKKASSVSLYIKGNDLVTHDESTSYYTVPLGQEFLIAYSLPDGARADFRYAYSVSYPSDSQDGNFHLTQNDDGTATCLAYTAYSGISVVFKAYYDDNSSTPDIVSSIQMNVRDPNAESKARAEAIVSCLDEGSLLSSKVSKSFNSFYMEDATSSISSEASFQAYADGSYLSIESASDGVDASENYYSTVYEGRHYAFQYGDSGAVMEVLANEASSDETYESPYLSLDGGYLKEGLKTHLGRFFDSSSEGSLLLFGDTNLYAYASFSFEEGAFSVGSTYLSDSGAAYEAVLEVSYSDGRLEGYSFVETMSSEYESFVYAEEGGSFEYGDKSADASGVIDMDSYFYSDLDLSYEIATDKDPEGRYDLSNPAKYFSGEGTEGEDGIVSYSLTTSQAIAIRIKRKEGVDSLATTAIDSFSMTSSDEKMVEPSSLLSNASSSDGSGLFIISPYKDTAGNIKEGEAIINISSQRGSSISFRLVYTKAPLSSIKVGGPNISDESSSLSLGEIFLGSLSPYFTINGEPDESSYIWDIEIVEGPEGGLALYQYEDGNIDNLYGYAVRGLKVGEYSFRISCSGSDVLSENAYSVTVKDSYSAEEIEAAVLGGTFVYRMGDSYKFILSFESASEVTLTQKISYDSSSVSASLSCSIEKGRIAMDEQSLPSGFYFSSIRGDIRFDEDFTVLKAYLDYDGTFATVSFERYVDKTDPTAYLPGKSFSTQENLNFGSGYMNYDMTLSFSSSQAAGSVEIVKHSDDSILATISFSYSYDSKWSQFSFTEVTSTSNSVTITDLSPYYNIGTSYGDYIDLTFTGSMKARFYI